MCDVLGGFRDVWQSVTEGRGGSKLAKNSVTYFMDGPFALMTAMHLFKSVSPNIGLHTCHQHLGLTPEAKQAVLKTPSLAPHPNNAPCFSCVEKSRHHPMFADTKCGPYAKCRPTLVYKLYGDGIASTLLIDWLIRSFIIGSTPFKALVSELC